MGYTSPAPRPFTAVDFESSGGGLANVSRTGTTCPYRDAPFDRSVTCCWSEPTKDEEIVAWARADHGTISPYSTGGVYVNHLNQDADDQVAAASQQNYERLRELKADWNPENLFSMNQTVDPNQGAE